jgi:O-antigen ligase
MIRRMRSLSPAGTFNSIQLWTTIVVLVLAPLFFGSVDLFWIAVWTILLSFSALCGLTVPMTSEQSRLLSGFLVLCGIYALIAVIQIVPHAVEQLDDPIWRQTNELLGLNTSPRISSRAEISPVAAGHFLLFATSFICGFSIGTSRRNSDLLIWFAQYSFISYVIYGLTAFSLTPDMLLWTNKIAYRGYLTATFVNHNTAATFVGAGAILWFCLAFSSAQSMRFSTIRMLLLFRANEALALKIVLRSAAALTCLFALLLTGSRGGLLCSGMGLLVAMNLMVANKWKLPRWYILPLAMTAFALIVILANRLGRIASQGLIDDNRLSVYYLSLQAIRERPFLGAGAGTFPDLFPAFRNNAISTWGVWDYAHSTILEIAFEMGIPVAVMITIAALVSVFILLRAAVATSDRADRRVLAAIAGIATLSYLHSTIDFSLQIPGYIVVFGILLGCGLARALAARAESCQMVNRTAVSPNSGQQPALNRKPNLDRQSV